MEEKFKGLFKGKTMTSRGKWLVVFLALLVEAALTIQFVMKHLDDPFLQVVAALGVSMLSVSILMLVRQFFNGDIKPGQQREIATYVLIIDVIVMTANLIVALNEPTGWLLLYAHYALPATPAWVVAGQIWIWLNDPIDQAKVEESQLEVATAVLNTRFRADMHLARIAYAQQYLASPQFQGQIAEWAARDTQAVLDTLTSGLPGGRFMPAIPGISSIVPPAQLVAPVEPPAAPQAAQDGPSAAEPPAAPPQAAEQRTAPPMTRWQYWRRKFRPARAVVAEQPAAVPPEPAGAAPLPAAPAPQEPAAAPVPLMAQPENPVPLMAIEPSASPTPAPAYTLDQLLAAMGVSRVEARSRLEIFDLTTPERAYALLTKHNAVPRGMSLAAFAPLFEELMKPDLADLMQWAAAAPASPPPAVAANGHGPN